MRAFFLANQKLDERIEEALNAFDEQLAGQQEIVDWLGWLSPAISLHEGLADIAGNGTRRYQSFQRQVTEFHSEWKRFFAPRVVDGIAITEADFAAMPRWHWQPDDGGQLWVSTGLRLLGIVLLTAALGAVAFRTLGRRTVV